MLHYCNSQTHLNGLSRLLDPWVNANIIYVGLRHCIRTHTILELIKYCKDSNMSCIHHKIKNIHDPKKLLNLIELNLFSKITKIHDKQSMNMHVILLRMTH